jgi:hypothetical protein
MVTEITKQRSSRRISSTTITPSQWHLDSWNSNSSNSFRWQASFVSQKQGGRDLVSVMVDDEQRLGTVVEMALGLGRCSLQARSGYACSASHCPPHDHWLFDGIFHARNVGEKGIELDHRLSHQLSGECLNNAKLSPPFLIPSQLTSGIPCG